MKEQKVLMETEKAVKHLRKHPRMKSVIDLVGEPEIELRVDLFASLVRSIVHQQISGKAAESIMKRFLDLFPKGKLSTKVLLSLADEDLRSAGLSQQKTNYLKDLALKFEDGTIDPKLFEAMSDEEIREHVIAVKGIGRWTADMFLMFSLGRPDVLPVGDLGIQKGFKILFELAELPSAEAMIELAREWEPYRTLASWYLWRVVDDRP